ncbi:MAG: hypothetical protein J6Y57_11290 [Lachnospiraceae bacterium]|nr:hypothetical protein [Lachnospiraceae bacterium]
MMHYEYDYVYKDVLIRSGETKTGYSVEILHKGQSEWKPLMSSGEDESYARAIFLGQGCWEDLKSVTEEEADAIMEEWGLKKSVKRTKPDSGIQREIEDIQLKKLTKKLSANSLVANPTLKYKNDPSVSIRPDFYSEEDHIIGEIHSHEGRLKAAQQKKIAADILKMLSFEKDFGEDFKKYIVVCDKEEYEQLQGGSYLAYAIKQYGVELMLLKLDKDHKKQLRKAMKEQDLRD